ncbi:MAG: type III pantothenate kinase [Verrucomicrobiota bacterium]
MNSNQNILCIDIGNTSIHYGSVSGKEVEKTADFPTAELLQEPKAFTETVAARLAEAAGVSFCSVVPDANTKLLDALATFSGPLFHLTHESCQGLDLVYPKPQEIGQDRIANALAAQEYYGIPAIVIDMGTAVTFDIISSQGYEGGIIAPGLNVMTRYLHEQTALLPELDPDELLQTKGAIGKSTIHAMQLGVSVGFSGMIDALLKRVEAELNEKESRKAVVLSTGGSVANLTADWASKSEFVDQLTLQGLAVAYQRAH